MTTEQDIIEGGKPLYLEGNEIGVLLSHGFTGTASCMKPLAQYLHQKTNWTVLVVQLKGHGETPQAMAQTTAEDWIKSIEEGLEKLQNHCSIIFMSGLSMGGCLTLYTAAMYPNMIKAAIPINACLYLDSADFAKLAYGSALDTIPGLGSDIKAVDVKEIVYKEVPVPAIRQIYALMGVTRDLLPKVVCPLLVMVSPEDHVVPASNANFILNQVSSGKREYLALENSYHVATIDNDQDLIHYSVLKFFQAQLN